MDWLSAQLSTSPTSTPPSGWNITTLPDRVATMLVWCVCVCVCVCVCACCWSAWSATLHQRVAGQLGVLHCTNELLVSLERTAISTLKQLQLGKHPLKKSLECISQSSTSKLGYLCMYTCSVVTVIPKCGQAYEGTSLLHGYRGFQVG